MRRQQILAIRTGDKLLDIGADDPSTWQQLAAQIRGLGIPRTTTILSALWPGQHVIMDWRTLSAALALTGARLGLDQTLVNPASTTRADKSWTSYNWYRHAVIACADQISATPLDVERALWRIGRMAPGITWTAYAELLEHDLAHWPRNHSP